MDKTNSEAKKLKADAQVGTWVVPMSNTGRADVPCEGSAHQPAPKAKKRIRLPPVSMRATAAQRAAIKAKARAAGLSVNHYLLVQALGHDLAPVKPSAEDRIERASALRAYRGTGNLLNQIAKHLNSGRVIGSVDIAEAIKRHEENAARVLAAFIRELPQ